MANLLSELEIDSLKGLENLTSLHLDFNQFSEIKLDWFQHNKN
jgi:hypothetical protein